MTRKFQDGDNVAHKSNTVQRMTVIGYTGDGRIICRWKDQTGFHSEEFLEPELETWMARPARCVVRG